MVLGTAGYMSPEQVRGKEVDARTDIFAFGAILYEMLSGQRAFKGESSIETMNAILKDDPPELDTDKLELSPGLERIVRRCLEKEPARRFHSARDVGFALEAISGTSSSQRVEPPRAAAGTPALDEGQQCWRWWPSAAVLAAYFLGKENVSTSTASYRQLTFEPGYAGPARFTRDGNTVVYSASWNGGARQLYSQRSNSEQATPLNLDADVMGIADNGDMAVILKRRFLATLAAARDAGAMPLEGGAPRPILEDVYEADITRDGKEFAVVRRDRGKQRLEFPIGKVLFETSGWITDVRISPDGTQVAFIDHSVLPDDRGAVAVVDRQGGVKRLTPYYATGRSLCWRPTAKRCGTRQAWRAKTPACTPSRWQERSHRTAVADGTDHPRHLGCGQGAAGKRALPNRDGREARATRAGRVISTPVGRYGIHVPRWAMDRLQPLPGYRLPGLREEGGRRGGGQTGRRIRRGYQLGRQYGSGSTKLAAAQTLSVSHRRRRAASDRSGRPQRRIRHLGE